MPEHALRAPRRREKGRTRVKPRHGTRSARRRWWGLGLLVVAALAVVSPAVLGRAHVRRQPATSHRRLETQGQAVEPAVFSRGSCVSYPPTAGDRHETVFLDAGHGGPDPGAIGTTTTGGAIFEADETLPVELGTMRLLRAEGFQVVVSRTRASTVVRLTPSDVSNGVLTEKGAHDDVAARDICANLAQASVLVRSSPWHFVR